MFALYLLPELSFTSLKAIGDSPDFWVQEGLVVNFKFSKTLGKEGPKG